MVQVCTSEEPTGCPNARLGTNVTQARGHPIRKQFAGERILVVEDDYLVVSDIVQDLEAAGAEVIGPVPSVQMGIQKVLTTPGIHAALLDINLQGSKVFPLADMLQERRIPIVFASAYDRSTIPSRHAASKLLSKPFQFADVLGALKSNTSTGSDILRSSPNRVLAALDDEVAQVLAPLMTPVRLGNGDILAIPKEGFSRVIFVEEGIISVIAEADQGQEIEVGLIGREGLLGAELVLEDDRSVCRAVVQIAGRGLAVDAASFSAACAIHAGLHSLVARYLRTLQIQATFTALANSKFNFEHRLARWLLMVDDRVPGNSVMLTHDLLALMLGAHRPGVTLALQTLEGHGYIRSLRGEVQIRDRDGLVAFAGGAYGTPEQAYKRLMRFDLAPVAGLQHRTN